MDTEHFVFVLVDEFSHIAFSCAVEPLRIANLVSGKPLFSWSFVSNNGETATCSNGSVTLVDYGDGARVIEYATARTITRGQYWRALLRGLHPRQGGVS